jgi:hypothetical protein
MNRFLSAGLLAVTLCGAGFVFAEDYPHAYPRKGVTKVFENDRVIIWNVNWLKNVPQPIHRHLYDMAGVYLQYGFINVTTPEGKVSPSNPFEVPRPYFQLRGVTHKEEAVGGPDDPERMAIMVDLKEPGPRGGRPVDFHATPAFPREGAKDVLDNVRVRMWDYTWVPKKAVGMHVHAEDSVEVFVTGGTLLIRGADGSETSKTFAARDARFVPRGTRDSEEATDGSPRAITIELK